MIKKRKLIELYKCISTDKFNLLQGDENLFKYTLRKYLCKFYIYLINNK